MSFDDKIANQAMGIVPLPNFDARPLEGPGRWAEVAPGVILYTDDRNVLFPKGRGEGFSELIRLIRRAYDSGETATEAFDRLRFGAPVVTGDLSELK